MTKSGREATVLSLIVLGVVFSVGLGDGWGVVNSVLGALFTGALAWVTVSAGSRRRDQARH